MSSHNNINKKLTLKKIAIITTHPIQYNAPLFKVLNKKKEIEIKVFYTWEQSKEKNFDKKFGKEIKWDIPLLEGYDYSFVKNTSKNPNSGTYRGVINPTLNEEIKSWGATHILIFGWNHHSHFKAMRYFKGKIPILFRGDSTLLDETPGIKTILRRIWLRYIYKHVDFVFFVGTNNKNYFLKHGLKEKQLIYVPHAIDNDRFFDKKGVYIKKAIEWRKKFNFQKKEIVFLFVGKFEQKKNPLLLIKAAELFPKQKFLFVGNGKLEKQMKNEAGKNVFFLPFQNQSNMPVIYRIGDIYVLPSRSETWGLAVNEALACERTVIVSDKVGCAVDMIKPNNGLIFKSYDEKDLINKMKDVIKIVSGLKSTINTTEILDEFSYNSIVNNIHVFLLNKS